MAKEIVTWIYSDEQAASELSRQLRLDNDELLKIRRTAFSLSMLAAGCMALISLYQMGIIRRLPEPSLPSLDAEKMDASEEAYQKLSMPDAVLGLASYSGTMALAAMGGKDRVKHSPWCRWPSRPRLSSMRLRRPN